jgi:hypothetical protein
MVSGLAVITGLIAVGVGVSAAVSRIREALRAYHKTATLYAAMPDGWLSWFLGGFSEVTIGVRYLRATAILVWWAATGLCLIALGFCLWGRA